MTTDSSMASHHHHDHEHAAEIPELIRIALVAVCAGLSWFDSWELFASFDFIALAGTLVGGYPIFKEAISNLLARRMTMELSMTIALVAALLIGEFFTALVIALFVLIAELLEGLTVGQGRQAIHDLLKLLPRQSVVRRASGPEQIDTEELSVGDIVIIKPGTALPVDGEVISGNSFVDEARITGESLPAEKVAGSRVYAGTLNQFGVLEVKTLGVGRDTAFGKIVEAVERAEKSKAPIQKLADRLAGYLVYFAFACATLTYFITFDVRSTISVIIVAGACGIAAGTPLAVLGAIGRAARNGAIVKGGRYLEVLGTIDTVVLDKTGTLTLGNPEVVSVAPATGVTEQRLLEAAAIAEKPSEHPLGKAILAKARDASLELPDPEEFSYTPGQGICCIVGSEEIVVGNRMLLNAKGIDIIQNGGGNEACTEILVARCGQYLGAFHVADVLRPEAAQAISELKSLGLNITLMTGDSDQIAQAIGGQLGVEQVESELLPVDKLARVRTLASQGRRVAMVGDGVNDAPALMEATVGVAMGSGADVALESADVMLVGNDLLKFAETVRIARQCRRIIFANFAGTLVVDVVGVGLAAFGYLNPLLAAFIHVSSELAFILNSARLVPRGK